MNIKTLLTTGFIAAVALSMAATAGANEQNISSRTLQMLAQAHSSIQQEYRLTSYAALEDDRQGSANTGRYGADNDRGQGDKSRTRNRDGAGSGGQHRYGQSSGGGNGPGGGNRDGGGGSGQGGGRH